jgi:hypothetical protein
VPKTTITIDRDQRDGLYELIRNHLGSVGDLFDFLERERDFVKAERLGTEFAEDFRLLQDLGWGEDDGRESVELTMPAHDLTEVLRRLHEEAEVLLAGAEGSRDDIERNQRFRQGRRACEIVLAGIDPEGGSAA